MFKQILSLNLKYFQINDIKTSLQFNKSFRYILNGTPNHTVRVQYVPFKQNLLNPNNGFYIFLFFILWI